MSLPKEFENKQSNEVSLLKLNADITSDKVAVQRATEQNKKLKYDLQGLEEAVVKMVCPNNTVYSTLWLCKPVKLVLPPELRSRDAYMLRNRTH